MLVLPIEGADRVRVFDMVAWAVQVVGDLGLSRLEGSRLAHLWSLDDALGDHVGTCAAADPRWQVRGLLL